MTEFDPFSLLSQGSSTVLHNVELIGVRTDVDGLAVLSLQLGNVHREIPSKAALSEEQLDLVGRFGYVMRDVEGGEATYLFRAYGDQSLRRVPELDTPAEDGWSCDRWPGGCRVPAGLIPGPEGRYLADETTLVAVRVPPEFLLLCRSTNLSPREVLESFIADAAGIIDDTNFPRADGFSSRGSDQRIVASAWLERALGNSAAALLDGGLRTDEASEHRVQVEEHFGALLGEFVDSGGDEDELRSVVEAMIEKQRHMNGSGRPGARKEARQPSRL